MKLAVIAGDGIGPEVIAEAVKVLDAVLPGVEKTELRPGRAALPRHRRGAARRRCSTSCAATTRSCSARSAIRRCPAACWSVACCCACGSRSTTTSTCGRPGCTRGEQPAGRQSRHRLRRGARGHRRPVHRHRRRDPRRHAARGRHRGQRQHRVRRAARGARRVRAGPAAAQASDAGAQEQRADLRGRAVVAHRAGGRRGVPRRRGRLPARRRRDHPHGHRSRAGST